MWFDLLLPGLDAAGAPIPLGGTSNHFITERAARPRRLGPVQRHRGRRPRHPPAQGRLQDGDGRLDDARGGQLGPRQLDPPALALDQGLHPDLAGPHAPPGAAAARRSASRASSRSSCVVGGTFIFLLNPIFWALTTLFFFTEAGFIQRAVPDASSSTPRRSSCSSATSSSCTSTSPARSSAGYFDLAKYALLSPLYWGLMSIAAWKGFLQLFYQPVLLGEDRARPRPRAPTPSRTRSRSTRVASRSPAGRPTRPRRRASKPRRPPGRTRSAAPPTATSSRQRSGRARARREMRHALRSLLFARLRRLLRDRLPVDRRAARRRLRRAGPPDARAHGLAQRPAEARRDRLRLPAADDVGVPAVRGDQAAGHVARRAAARRSAFFGGCDRRPSTARWPAATCRGRCALLAARGLRAEPAGRLLRRQRHERGRLLAFLALRALLLRLLVRHRRSRASWSAPGFGFVAARPAALRVHHLGGRCSRS